MKPDTDIFYPARSNYSDYQKAVDYETKRFSGLTGRYRRRREADAASAVIAQLPGNISVLDCPCGTGRWWDTLSVRASQIVAMDLSEGMRRYAGERARSLKTLSVEVVEGDAEALPLPDNAVDFTFSFALTKHLPRPTQYQVLREFSRVSRQGVVASFGVFTHTSYEIWRRRSLPHSYPLLREELNWMADAAGLQVEMMRKCTSPLGVEKLVLFRSAG